MQKTISQFLLQELSRHSEKLVIVQMILDIAVIGKVISKEVNRAGVGSLLGATGNMNVQGEHTQKLDEFANDFCKQYLRETGHFAALASEEEAGIVDLGEACRDAQYVIAFDPLDGSSNIDVNVSVGTIFSVHKRLADIPPSGEAHFLQPGRDQVLAGYILYGSSTVLVCSTGNGVHEFTLDPGIGEFVLSRASMTLPAAAPYYSVNEGNTPHFQLRDIQYIAQLKERGMSTRYIGSMVADIHRNLISGGVFLYPAIDKEQRGAYRGKLRLNYEAKPMAFLYEQAGGAAFSDGKSVLDIVPSALHERVPLAIGNKDVLQSYI